MGDRTGLQAAERGIEAPAPELGHRQIGNRPQVEIVAGMHVIGFDREGESVLAPKGLQPFGMMRNNQLAAGLAQIP